MKNKILKHPAGGSSLMMILVLTFMITFDLSAQLTIQEESAGFCSTDGVLVTPSTAEGYTGTGYLDYVTFAKWSVDVQSAGTYTLTWRYALGGGNTDSRNGQVYLNDVELVDTVVFDHTGDWAAYSESSIQMQLAQGINEIRIRAFVTPYLPHIDYFMVEESGVSVGDCISRYSLSVGINDSSAGSVSYEPVQEFYVAGTEITLTATPNPGYFFQSWEGNDADTARVYKLKIRKNTELVGRFLPEGTRQVKGVYGYATVQDDKGTPYLLTGGSLGDTVVATTLEDLQQLLAGDEPRVVTLDRHLVGPSSIQIGVGSNKTLLGISNEAHIQGVRTQLNGSKNVIIKKIRFSKTITYDALQINGASEQVWIDSCEFFSDRDHHKDYYDGLLDIKNSSSFITVSHTVFHDHHKSILISSGDQEVQDSVIRITFHHNYFYNNGSRLPSLRFGKAHIFNNYYKNNDGGVNTRVGACIRVEKNLFESNNGGMLGKTGEAYYHIIDNIGAEPPSDIPSCVLDVPYEYESILETDPNELKYLVNLVLEEEEENEEEEEPLALEGGASLAVYPNPARGSITVDWNHPGAQGLNISIINITGVRVLERQIEGSTQIDTSNLPRGAYIIRFSSGQGLLRQQTLILK